MKIDKGILLEDRNDLLPWRTTLSALMKIGDPRIVRMSDRVVLQWDNRKILEGLVADIEISFFDNDEIFTSAEGVYVKNTREEFNRVSQHLLKKLGDPIKKIDTDDYDRYWRWEIDNIEISVAIFEMHSARCVLKIAEKNADDKRFS